MPDPRRLAAILVADTVGFSRLMERDELGTFARMRALRDEVFLPQLSAHGGRLVKTTGDGMLAEFSSANAAVDAALRIQTIVREREGDIALDDRIRLRIGINLGDVISDGDDIAGDGVNIAARLEPIAPPGGVCLAASVRDQLRQAADRSLRDLGELQLKNIARPIRAFVLDPPGAAPTEAFSVRAPVQGFRGRPAIAVLPFESQASDTDPSFFADGLAEDLLTRLGMWRWMPVIARNSSFAFRGSALDPKAVGAQLGARYIVQGSVRRSGERLRVAARLTDVELGLEVWSQRYDREQGDVFLLQDEIAAAISAALEPAIGKSERRKASLRPSQSLDAWEMYHQAAWHFSKFTRESLQESLALCMRSAELDASFSTPLSGAACCKLLEALFLFGNPATCLAEAHALSVRAVERDPDDPFALCVMAQSCSALGQLEASAAHAERALEINPSLAPAHYALGTARLLAGEAGRAVQAIETACRLSPHDPMFEPSALSTLSFSHYMLGDYESARQIAGLVISRAPGFPTAHRAMAIALAQLGRIDEGRQVLSTYLTMVPFDSEEKARALAPFRLSRDFEHFMAGLRKLGWPGIMRS